jgi:hypothetical protein
VSLHDTITDSHSTGDGFLAQRTGLGESGMEHVHLSQPGQRLDAHDGWVSGGGRQRVLVGRDGASPVTRDPLRPSQQDQQASQARGIAVAQLVDGSPTRRDCLPVARSQVRRASRPFEQLDMVDVDMRVILVPELQRLLVLAGRDVERESADRGGCAVDGG